MLRQGTCVGQTREVRVEMGAAREVRRGRARSDSNTVEQRGPRVPVLGSACAQDCLRSKRPG